MKVDMKAVCIPSRSCYIKSVYIKKRPALRQVSWRERAVFKQPESSNYHITNSKYIISQLL